MMEKCKGFSGSGGVCTGCKQPALLHADAPRPHQRGCYAFRADEADLDHCAYCCLPREWHFDREAQAVDRERAKSKVELAVVEKKLTDAYTRIGLMEGPIPMLLWCPECKARHIDAGVFATKAHHTHACQNCGHCWRPAVVSTVGVKFLPGFKDAT